MKSKEEKAWPWKRRSRHQHRAESDADNTTEQPAGTTNEGAAMASGTLPVESHTEPQPETQTETQATQPAAQPAAQPQTEETASQTDSVARRESKFKNWFKGKLGRRSSAPPQKQTNGTYESVQSIPVETGAEGSEGVVRAETSEETGRLAHESEAQDESRVAPLRSNPVTAEDLNRRAEERASYDEGMDNPDGGSPAKYATAENSEATGSSKQQERADSVHDLPSTPNKAKEENVAEPLPAPPSMGEVVNKRRPSNGTARESRFSEDL